MSVWHKVLLRLALWRFDAVLLAWVLAGQKKPESSTVLSSTPSGVFWRGHTPLTCLAGDFSKKLGKDFSHRLRHSRKQSLSPHWFVVPGSEQRAIRFLACASLLLDAGHSLNERDRSGCTFLSFAVGRRIAGERTPLEGSGETGMARLGNNVELQERHAAVWSPLSVTHLRRDYSFSRARMIHTWIETNVALLQWLTRRGEVFDWQDLPLVATDGERIEKEEARRILPLTLAMAGLWPRIRDKGVDRHARGRDGWSLLHEACGGNFPSPHALRGLLEDGLDWNAVGNGQTPARLLEETCMKNPALRAEFEAALSDGSRSRMEQALPEAAGAIPRSTRRL